MVVNQRLQMNKTLNTIGNIVYISYYLYVWVKNEMIERLEKNSKLNSICCG